MDVDAGMRTVSGMDEDGGYTELKIPKEYSNWNDIVLADAERYVFSGAELVEVIDQMLDESRQDFPVQDAKLIAAAPDLLEALKESLALNINWSETAEDEHLRHLSEYTRVIEQARVAIEKATNPAKPTQCKTRNRRNEQRRSVRNDQGKAVREAAIVCSWNGQWQRLRYSL